MASNASSSSSDEVTVEKVKVVSQKKTKKISDRDWIESLPEKERKYYEVRGRSHEEVEEMTLNCTACFKQINHKVDVSREKQY